MWYHLDVNTREGKDKVLGRVATRIAKILQGKHKPDFAPHKPGEDYIIVNNVEALELTGNKKDEKEYITHSGYVGGIKRTPYKKQIEKDPTSILKYAVKGMLPKNRLRDERLARLKIYTGSEHPHEAQQPVPFPENV